MLERFTLAGRGGRGAVLFNGAPLNPGPSQQIRNHSPDGFAWGYGGSGPAQLALAVLLQTGLPVGLALRHYKNFKNDHIATLPDTFDVQIDFAAWGASQKPPIWRLLEERKVRACRTK